MKARIPLLVSAIVIGLGASFWLYGGARTMGETASVPLEEIVFPYGSYR